MPADLRPISPRGPNPPAHLSEDAAGWWRVVNRDYALEGHHLKLLQSAAESWDRSQEARGILDREGVVVLDRFGQPKVHPAVSVERDARMAFIRAVRTLDLDAETATPGMRVRRR